MSNRLLKEVRRLENLRGPGRPILMVLADHADEKGVCWPSIATIAREAGFSPTTVKFHLRSLRDVHGLVSWVHRVDGKGDQTSNLYRVQMKEGEAGADPPPSGADPGVGREATGVGREPTTKHQ